MNHPTFRETPEYRSYVHTTCGETTGVNGDEFLGLCDPMHLWLTLLPQKTMCVHCGRPRPLNEFKWEDTKETLADYRARLRRSLPWVHRVGAYFFRLALFLLFVVGGAWLGYLWTGVILGVIGGLLGSCFGIIAAAILMLIGQRDFRRYR